MELAGVVWLKNGLRSARRSGIAASPRNIALGCRR
jgi:hypothetical protein